MSALSNQALEKLTGKPVIHRLFDDAKSGAVLFIDTEGAHLVEGKTLAEGVALVTQQRPSIHSSIPLFAVIDLASWLDGVTQVDERHMAWGRGTSDRQSTPYREAIRYGHKVLVLQGCNNSRDLQTVGLTFGTVERAQRFFSLYASKLPKGMTDTGPSYVPARGGVAREYFPPAKQEGKKVTKALGRVIDETLEWTLDFSGGNFECTRQTFASNEAAIAALSAKELDWYRLGGRPYEIEWMSGLKNRESSTLVEYVDEATNFIDQVGERGAKWVDAPRSHTAPEKWIQSLAIDAGLTPPTPPPSDAQAWRAWLRTQPAAHWLLVGQRLPKKVLSHQVMNKRGVSVYFDADHGAVAVVTATPNHTWAVVKRGATAEKAKALWAATLKRFKLA